MSPSPNSNVNPKPNTDPDGGNFLDTLRNSITKILFTFKWFFKMFPKNHYIVARFRSSHRRCSIKKLLLQTSGPGKQLSYASLLKKRLWHWCSVNFIKSFRTPLCRTPSTDCYCRLEIKRYRSSRQTCSVKRVFLEIFQNSQENTYARVYILIKLQGSAVQLYWNRDFGTGVFLWILRSF